MAACVLLQEMTDVRAPHFPVTNPSKLFHLFDQRSVLTSRFCQARDMFWVTFPTFCHLYVRFLLLFLYSWPKVGLRHSLQPGLDVGRFGLGFFYVYLKVVIHLNNFVGYLSLPSGPFEFCLSDRCCSFRFCSKKKKKSIKVHFSEPIV